MLQRRQFNEDGVHTKLGNFLKRKNTKSGGSLAVPRMYNSAYSIPSLMKTSVSYLKQKYSIHYHLLYQAEIMMHSLGNDSWRNLSQYYQKVASLFGLIFIIRHPDSSSVISGQLSITSFGVHEVLSIGVLKITNLFMSLEFINQFRFYII